MIARSPGAETASMCWVRGYLARTCWLEAQFSTGTNNGATVAAVARRIVMRAKRYASGLDRRTANPRWHSNCPNGWMHLYPTAESLCSFPPASRAGIGLHPFATCYDPSSMSTAGFPTVQYLPDVPAAVSHTGSHQYCRLTEAGEQPVRWCFNGRSWLGYKRRRAAFVG